MHLQFCRADQALSADVIIPAAVANKVAIDLLLKTKIRELLRERGVSVDPTTISA